MVVSVIEAVNRSQQINTAAARAETSIEHGHAHSLQGCLFKFEI